MQEEAAKMKAFVIRLWENPAIKDFPLNKKEAHLLGFLKENESQLRKFLHPLITSHRYRGSRLVGYSLVNL